jgi:pyruvate/2-oxoglutarate dehydrogenase complex dihydrolipoamide acyltransferase (E2) component
MDVTKSVGRISWNTIYNALTTLFHSPILKILMNKITYLFALMSLCLACGSSFAADPKPADAKAAAPASAAPAPATTTAPAAAPTKAATPAAAEEPAVKKSNTSICHDKSSPSYTQTKNFTEFKTMEECIKSGGRAPKGGK